MKKQVAFLILIVYVSYTLPAESKMQAAIGPVYGPEAYSLGVKCQATISSTPFFYGGYIIAGIAPVSGAIGAVAGIDWGFGIIELASTLSGWASERMGVDAQVGYFSLNPKFGLYFPFSLLNSDWNSKLMIKAGPSFGYPKEWDHDGVNVLFLERLWNFEIIFEVTPGKK